MPIYGYGVVGAPWTLAKITDKQSIAFQKILKKAIKSFQYSKDEVFIHSIEINYRLTDCSIAKYDYSKTSIPEFNYQNELDCLIREANNLLSKERKYDNFKFDITGNWVTGRIIMMTKNKEG